MSETKEKTAQIPAVGAAGEQSIPNNLTDHNIAENTPEFNDEFPWEEQRRLFRLLDPHYLNTVSMTELYENVYRKFDTPKRQKPYRALFFCQIL